MTIKTAFFTNPNTYVRLVSNLIVGYLMMMMMMMEVNILKPKVHLTHHPHVKFPSTEEVEVSCLDSYDCFEYNFINMDVQGYELEVLKGGTKTLEKVDYVYCEVNRDEVYENNAYVEELDEFLKEYNMERVMTSWEGQIWGDALYVRKNLL